MNVFSHTFTTSTVRTYRMIVLFIFIAIAILHAIGFQYSLYYHLWWYDIPMHIFGGLAIALLAGYIFFLRTEKNEYPAIRKVLITIFASVMVVGILWEVFEFAMHWFLSLYWFGWFDTIKDLFDDIVGAFIGAKIFLTFLEHHKT